MIETYLEHQERVLCENSSTLTNNIIYPKCVDGKKEYEVTIKYNDVEKDTLHLCAKCMVAVKRDAMRHGYSVRTKRMKEAET